MKQIQLKALAAYMWPAIQRGVRNGVLQATLIMTGIWVLLGILYGAAMR